MVLQIRRSRGIDAAPSRGFSEAAFVSPTAIYELSVDSHSNSNSRLRTALRLAEKSRLHPERCRPTGWRSHQGNPENLELEGIGGNRPQ